MINTNKISLIVLLFLYCLSSIFLSSNPIVKASTEITKDFDIRTNSSMSEEQFKEAFKGGLLEDKYQLVSETSKKYGINAGFVASIMLHETGRGTSDMIKEINNPGGLTCSASSNGGKTESIGVSWDCVKRGDRKWKKFDNLDDAIKEKIDYLNRFYAQKDKTTIYKVQQTYCPDKDKGCEVWVTNVIKAMAELGEGTAEGLASPDGSIKDSVASNEDYLDYKSYFEELSIDEENFSGAGINTKKENSGTYQDYKISGWMKFLVNSLRILTMVVSILIFGYVSLIWMLILLARTHMLPIEEFLRKISLGFIDPYKDLGKMIKVTVIVFLLVAVSASGLMPLIFMLIYQGVLNILNYIF